MSTEPVLVSREVDEEYYATFWVVEQGETKVLLFERDDPRHSERLAERIATLLREGDL